MTEYWLISAPGDKTCQQTWETVNNLTNKQNTLSSNYKFHIPDLKVGTLDQLVGLSDDLGKLDSFVEQVTRKVASYLGEVLEDQRDKLHENLLANNSHHSHANQHSHHSHSNISIHKKFGLIERCWGSTKHRGNTKREHSEHKRTIKSLEDVSTLTHSDDEGNESFDTDDDGDSECRRWTTNWKNHEKCQCSAAGHGDNMSPRSRAGSNCDMSPASSPLSFSASSTTGDRFSPSSYCNSEQGLNRASVSTPPPPDDHDAHASFMLGRPIMPDMHYYPASVPYPLAPADLPTYITHFQWDMAKYPIKQSLRNIADIISKQVAQIDADLKTKSTAYNNLKGNLQNLEKKQTGSLLTRNLTDIVKREHFVLDSEYLTTLLVIVPKQSINIWNQNYEKISDMIVPRSSQMVMQDNDNALFTVSMFKKVVDEFKFNARKDYKFIVRDFTYNEEEVAAGKHEITKLVTDKKKQFGPLVRWLKVNFSECFCAWIHVKALRVFVESVLRYGLPVNFQAILLHPNKKCAKRLRDILNQLYGHLDSSALSGGTSQNDNVDIPGLGFGQADYYPYVYYKINVDMVDSKV